MEILNILVLILTTALGIMLLLRTRKVGKYLRTLNILKVDINNPYLPDYVVHNDQAIRFPIGNKFIYLQPLTAAQFNRFSQWLHAFIDTYKAYLDWVARPTEEWDEKCEDDIQKLFVDNDDAIDSFMGICKEVLLADPLVNRDRVSYKYFKANIRMSTLIVLWMAMYDRNVNSVRSFISSLRARLGESQAMRKPGLGLWNLQDAVWMMQQISQSQKSDSLPADSEKGSRDKMTKLTEI